jgi:hypothetical protein
MGDDLETLSKEQLTRLAQYFDEAVRSLQSTNDFGLRFRARLAEGHTLRLEVGRA